MTKTRVHQNPGETWWRGRQWCVTDYGLETWGEPYHYHMTAKQIQTVRPEEPVLDSMIHMMEKEWLDLDDFLTAYMVALALHGGQGGTLRDSIKGALQQLRHYGVKAQTKMVGQALGGPSDPVGPESGALADGGYA